MTDQQCVEFLRWALPRLHMRWRGFRKPRRQVRRRIERRIRELGLADTSAYREYLEQREDEWERLDTACRVSISRFYRNHGVFDFLRDKALPELAQEAVEHGRRELSAWSAGCACGEEPYTLALIWQNVLAARFVDIDFQVIATDAEPQMLTRASAARYPTSSLKELPADWIHDAFRRDGEEYVLDAGFRRRVSFAAQDLRHAMPEGPFDIILCRNLAFTYFDEWQQRRIGNGLADRLRSGGFLVLGAHEQLPPGDYGLAAIAGHPSVYRREAKSAGDEPSGFASDRR